MKEEYCNCGGEIKDKPVGDEIFHVCVDCGKSYGA